jgi:hypothetical protein
MYSDVALQQQSVLCNWNGWQQQQHVYFQVPEMTKWRSLQHVYVEHMGPAGTQR